MNTEQARRKGVGQGFSSLGEERVAVTFDRVQGTVTRSLTALSARVVYAAISPTGVELRAMQNRLTWVCEPEEMAPGKSSMNILRCRLAMI
jgi:hypothetical protein